MPEPEPPSARSLALGRPALVCAALRGSSCRPEQDAGYERALKEKLRVRVRCPMVLCSGWLSSWLYAGSVVWTVYSNIDGALASYGPLVEAEPQLPPARLRGELILFVQDFILSRAAFLCARPPIATVSRQTEEGGRWEGNRHWPRRRAEGKRRGCLEERLLDSIGATGNKEYGRIVGKEGRRDVTACRSERERGAPTRGRATEKVCRAHFSRAVTRDLSCTWSVLRAVVSPCQLSYICAGSMLICGPSVMHGHCRQR